MKNKAIKMRCKQGFTLIELLVVVLIIAVLAAVALPQYNKAVRKAQTTEVWNAIDALDKALSAYHLQVGSYMNSQGSIVSQDELDIKIPTLKYFQYQGMKSYDPTFEFTSGRYHGSGEYAVSFKKDGLELEAYFSPKNPVKFHCTSTSKHRPCTDFFPNCAKIDTGSRVSWDCNF